MFGGCGGSGATSRAELELQREVEVPQLKLLRVNRQLAMKPQHASRLELLLHERLNKIDQPTLLFELGYGLELVGVSLRVSLNP